MKLWFPSVHSLIPLSLLQREPQAGVSQILASVNFFTFEEMLKCTRWEFHGIWFLNSLQVLNSRICVGILPVACKLWFMDHQAALWILQWWSSGKFLRPGWDGEDGVLQAVTYRSGLSFLLCDCSFLFTESRLENIFIQS